MQNTIWKILAKIFLSDPDKIQVFLLSVLGKINVTDRPILSMLVEALKAIVENDEAWELLFDLILSLLNEDTTETVRGDIVTARANAIKAAVGEDKTNIDPATIIMIITAVIELIKMWRDRKNA